MIQAAVAGSFRLIGCKPSRSSLILLKLTYTLYIDVCSGCVAFLLIKACKCAKNIPKRTKPSVLRKILSQGPDMISRRVRKPEKPTTPGSLLYPLFALFLLSLFQNALLLYKPYSRYKFTFTILIFFILFLYFLFPGSHTCLLSLSW